MEWQGFPDNCKPKRIIFFNLTMGKNTAKMKPRVNKLQYSKVFESEDYG